MTQQDWRNKWQESLRNSNNLIANRNNQPPVQQQQPPALPATGAGIDLGVEGGGASYALPTGGAFVNQGGGGVTGADLQNISTGIGQGGAGIGTQPPLITDTQIGGQEMLPSGGAGTPPPASPFDYSTLEGGANFQDPNAQAQLGQQDPYSFDYSFSPIWGQQDILNQQNQLWGTAGDLFTNRYQYDPSRNPQNFSTASKFNDLTNVTQDRLGQDSYGQVQPSDFFGQQQGNIAQAGQGRLGQGFLGGVDTSMQTGVPQQFQQQMYGGFTGGGQAPTFGELEALSRMGAKERLLSDVTPDVGALQAQYSPAFRELDRRRQDQAEQLFNKLNLMGAGRSGEGMRRMERLYDEYGRADADIIQNILAQAEARRGAEESRKFQDVRGLLGDIGQRGLDVQRNENWLAQNQAQLDLAKAQGQGQEASQAYRDYLAGQQLGGEFAGQQFGQQMDLAGAKQAQDMANFSQYLQGIGMTEGLGQGEFQRGMDLRGLDLAGQNLQNQIAQQGFGNLMGLGGMAQQQYGSDLDRQMQASALNNERLLQMLALTNPAQFTRP
jgi:hypothetical protein